MKKYILLLLVFISLLLFFSSKNKEVKIPDSAIRFRILANSNSLMDQKIKNDIKLKMQKELYNVLKESKNIKDARYKINYNMNNFKSILDDETKNLPYSYKIDYGMHLFPEKIYKGVKYESGNYESLLVTLGKGDGDNWWCVLFPPMCVLEAEETKINKVEYKFFIKELIKKYF